jgi:hypothetical protein
MEKIVNGGSWHMNKKIKLLAASVVILVGAGILWGLHARKEAQRNECNNNLRQIYAAMYATSLADKYPEGAVMPTAAFTKYMKKEALPECPSGGKYNIPPVGKVPTCSFHGDVLGEEAREYDPLTELK